MRMMLTYMQPFGAHVIQTMKQLMSSKAVVFKTVERIGVQAVLEHPGCNVCVFVHLYLTFEEFLEPRDKVETSLLAETLSSDTRNDDDTI